MATPLISKLKKKTDINLPEAKSVAKQSANKSVEKELLVIGSRKRKRGQYRCNIARYAIENGNSRAAKHFSSVLERSVNESTVRGIKTAYNRRRTLDKEFDQSTSVSLPRSPQGRPTKLGKYDEFV